MDFAERMLKLSPYTLTMHKEMYKMAYDMRGIQQIIPFSKEIFNVSMQLPGTAENEALWEIAKTQGGAAMDSLDRRVRFERKSESSETLLKSISNIFRFLAERCAKSCQMILLPALCTLLADKDRGGAR